MYRWWRTSSLTVLSLYSAFLLSGCGFFGASSSPKDDISPAQAQRVLKTAYSQMGKKYRSMRQDYARLLEELHTNPTAGVSLGRGVRKVRMAIASKNKGKSHGARVITFTYSVDEESGTIVLLFLYDKEERDTITSAEIDTLLEQVKKEV